MNKPIFINGCTKSGTTLLRSLFDSHKELFAIPSETHFFQNIHFWVSYYYRKTKPKNLSYQEMKKNLLNWLIHLNQTKQEVTDGFTSGKWNINKIEELLFSEDVTNLRDLSDLFVKSIYYGLFNRSIIPEIEFVEKSVENAEFAFEWKELYPEARFIHILRNPYSNIVALRKYAQRLKSTKKYPYLKYPMYSMQNSYYFLYKNKAMIKNYKVIRYEDLLIEPEKTIKDLSTWLNIKFSDNLLQPTILGEPWGGNSTSGKSFSKISSENLTKWKQEINTFETHLINKHFDFILSDFNYGHFEKDGNINLPMSGEKLTTYLQNRLLSRFLPNFN